MSCKICGATPAPSGVSPNKYCCKKQGCQDAGLAAGHIKAPGEKRQRAASPASSAVPDVALLAAGSLIKIEKICGCRRAHHLLPPPAPRPRPSCSDSSPSPSLAALARRTCDPSKLDEVDRRNGLKETEMEDNLEYLVLGHFEKNDRDVKGYDDTVWLTLTELEEAQQLSEQDLDAHLEQWERESARMRHARARARARPA
jgi:hypothetical protein